MIRPLTDFEEVLLAFISHQPRTGYELKRLFSTTPASVYRHGPGALYPALRRLVDRGLLSVEETVSDAGRDIRVYRATTAGFQVHGDWLRQPVDSATIGNDLGMHLMRFAMMEGLDRQEVAAFLVSLADALDGFISGMQDYLDTQGMFDSWFGVTAVRHGIAVHRASLEWARATLADLEEQSIPADRAVQGLPRDRDETGIGQEHGHRRGRD